MISTVDPLWPQVSTIMPGPKPERGEFGVKGRSWIGVGLGTPREPKGAAADWTEERRRSDEGRRRVKRRPEASGKTESVVEAEAAELLGVALPVLGDLDVQVEVDPGAQESLDLPAGAGADVLQPRSPGADDDGLLARPLHVQLGVHIGQVVPAGVRAHLLDHDRDRVRQLVPDALQGRLPD